MSLQNKRSIGWRITVRHRWLIFAFAAIIAFGPRLVFASCANVTSSESGDAAVDTSFPLVYALGEFIILCVAAGWIAVRRTQSGGPYFTKGNMFATMIALQAVIFLGAAIMAFMNSGRGAMLPPSTKDIVFTSLVQSVSLTILAALIFFVVSLMLSASRNMRLKARQLMLGSAFALLAYVPIYTFLLFTPHC